MNKIFENLDFEIYEEKLDNGLRIYLCNIPRYNIHARMTSLFGGSMLEFKLKGDKEFTKVPAGVAHFLEHKLFEKENYDPIKIYENNGASFNAFTNEFITSYYFSGVDNFFDNLNNLLKCVSEPYFTDENVLKEKGIIFQEKKEDMDNIYSIVYDKALENTFENLDYKNTVLGSLDDINSITKEDLYKCFDTFYHPSNMLLTICGDIDIDKTMKFIKEFYEKEKISSAKEIIINEKKEPEKVVKAKEIIHRNIQSKQIFINYKVKKPNKMNDKYLDRLYFSLILDMKFSGLAEISNITNKDTNFLSSISPRITEVSDYYLISFQVTVKDNTDEVIKLIDDTLKNDDYSIKRFNLIKKVILNSLVLSTENPYDICSMIVRHITLYGKLITDMHKKIFELDFKTFKEYIKCINLENRSIVVLEK